MPRYFLEVRYLGGRYAGSQIQVGAETVQGTLERALGILFREPVGLTGSSRTDVGVHAFCNFFHFDHAAVVDSRVLRGLNALLPSDVAAISLQGVPPDAHCRFDACSRYYCYRIHDRKDPFLSDRSWFYPYPLAAEPLHEMAGMLLGTANFQSFSKRATQVGTYICTIQESRWVRLSDGWAYYVKGDRFLRGMVRGLVGTMLQGGRGRLSGDGFRAIWIRQDNANTDFTPPGHGLTLLEVGFPPGLLNPIRG